MFFFVGLLVVLYYPFFFFAVDLSNCIGKECAVLTLDTRMLFVFAIVIYAHTKGWAALMVKFQI